MIRIRIALLAALAVLIFGVSQTPAQPQGLIARIHDTDFALAHDTYNGMRAASDGNIYYVLSSELADVAGRMCVYNPSTGKTRTIGDLTDICGEKGTHAIAQGKSHVNFVEHAGKLYFSTHVGYYTLIDDIERPGIPPAGMTQYPGGHLLAYDMASGKFQDFGVNPRREGLISMNMDTRRMRIYTLTWPSGIFYRYDIARKEWKELGSFFKEGETGKGAAYRTICRSIAIDPDDGSVYFSTSEGLIKRYRYDRDAVETVKGDNLKKDYFGIYDVTSPGHMAYNWRQVFYYPPTHSIYGVHGNSGYLFRFDPRAERVEVLDRITSLPSQRSGMFDEFSYGYLGFTLGPDGQTIYYLTGGPIYRDGKRIVGKESTGQGEAKGDEDLHLVTYHIPTGKYRDWGAVQYAGGGHPTYVNSIAVAKDGTVYTIARVPRPGNAVHASLISFKPAL